MSRDELKNKIYGALGDPKAPWYGSDLVAWVGDYIEDAEKRIEEIEAKLLYIKQKSITLFEAKDLAEQALNS